MAIEELSTRASDCYIGGNFNMIWRLAGDSVHQCAYVVEGDASVNGEVIACSTDGLPLAVTALQASLDIDTEVTEGVMYEYYLLHSATMLWLPHDTNADAIVEGDSLIRSASVAGMVDTPATSVANVVGWIIEKLAAAVDLYIKAVT